MTLNSSFGMPSLGNIPPRLPPKDKLRSSLKPTSDLAVLNTYLQTVAKQPKGQENGLRILLQTCSELGNEKFVEALLCRGADVNAYNKTSLPALHCAAKEGHVCIIELLLFSKAKIDLVDSGGRTALMHAALNGKTAALQKLLNKGASIGAKDRQGRNVVIHAASGGHIHTLEVLLQGGADPEHADDAGRTASICAAANNDPGVLKLLLSRVAIPRAADNDGRSILAYAIANEKASIDDKKQVLTLLLEARVDVKQIPHSLQSIRSAALSGQHEILKLLIKHKANVNASDENGRSALLHLASDPSKNPKWDEQTLSILINAQANVYKVDHDKSTGRKRTALQWAAATGHEVVAKAVLRHNPNTATIAPG